jgi:polyisoprenoid-binding protein YceI
MKKIKLLIGIVTILLTSAFVLYQSADWKVKDNYIIKFRFGKYTFGVDSMPAPNYGTIKGLKASISFDQDNLEKSKITASIDAKTVDTGEPSKNSSATGPDVLIADKFPLVTFESTSITKVNNGYEAIGKLTIKNISKEIKFPFVFQKETFNGGFTIDTKDFNFTHPHVPKEITIFFTIPVTK